MLLFASTRSILNDSTMPDVANTFKYALLLILLGLAGLTACSRPTQIESTWHEPARSSRLFDKVLVVGISENARQRRRFENTMTAKLEKAGVVALASNRLMDKDAEPNQENVGKVVESTGATAILISRLVSHDVTSSEVEERTEIKTRRRSDTPVVDFFQYDYEEYDEAAYLVVKSTVSLSTDLYATRNGKLIYSIATTTFDKETGFEILDEVTTAIVSQLQRDDLIL